VDAGGGRGRGGPAAEPYGLTLVVHHKPTYAVGYSRERELQAGATAPFVDEQLAGRQLHEIVLGDFGDTPDSASIGFWTGRQSLDGLSVAYRDAWESIHPAEPGHTFAADNAPLTRAGEMSLELGRRIDYILVRCGIHGAKPDVIDSRRMFDQEVDGVWGRDHYGVVADLSRPRPSTRRLGLTAQRGPGRLGLEGLRPGPLVDVVDHLHDLLDRRTEHGECRICRLSPATAGTRQFQQVHALLVAATTNLVIRIGVAWNSDPGMPSESTLPRFRHEERLADTKRSRNLDRSLRLVRFIRAAR
jgi:hypothetical protein